MRFELDAVGLECVEEFESAGVQREDGGWGERCNTYDDPVFKGQGPSTASQTAWAVMGLMRSVPTASKGENPAGQAAK